MDHEQAHEVAVATRELNAAEYQLLHSEIMNTQQEIEAAERYEKAHEEHRLLMRSLRRAKKG